MLTVFYCTRKSNPEYIHHIQKTIGVKDVEIVEFVNNGEMSLAESYNQALEQSKYDKVLLIHDDLVFHTKNWGKKLLTHFNTSDYGILGLAGTPYLPTSGAWMDNKTLWAGVVWHQKQISDKGKIKTIKYPSHFSPSQPNHILPAVVLDGLFLFVDKTKIKSNFDERFEGFHFYDVPFTLNNHLNGVKVGIISDIKVLHKSVGEPNDKWYLNKDKFVKLYKEHLPAHIVPNIPITNKTFSFKKEPKVTIIIPTKNNFDLLQTCVNSFFEKSKYSNYEIIIADTGSDEKTLESIKELIKPYNHLNLVQYDYYNFAEINNDVVRNHLNGKVDLLLFCNDDIEILNDVISEMVFTYMNNKQTVGTIGCRLYFPNKTIQHGGIEFYALRDTGKIKVTHKGLNSYYGASFNSDKGVLGSTGACLMISKKLFTFLGGFHKTNECFEDVILNIDCILKGKKNIFLGSAVAYHKESSSRKKDINMIDKINADYKDFLYPKILKNFSKLKSYIKIING